MQKYEITIKEKEKDFLLTISYSGRELTEQEIIDFFGLNDDDVEWWKIEEVK